MSLRSRTFELHFQIHYRNENRRYSATLLLLCARSLCYLTCESKPTTPLPVIPSHTLLNTTHIISAQCFHHHRSSSPPSSLPKPWPSPYPTLSPSHTAQPAREDISNQQARRHGQDNTKPRLPTKQAPNRLAQASRPRHS